MTLAVTNIVEFRNGGKGVVVGWKDNAPAYVVGARFTNPVTKWNEEGRFSNRAEKSPYDITAVYDGSTIDDPIKAFRASVKLETLPQIWHEAE